jgi:hypothetical protein
VLLGLALNAAAGWWWAAPLSGLVIAADGICEGSSALAEERVWPS